MTDADQRAKADSFLALHHGPEPLLLANSWDVASTRLVAAAGYKAIATTSAGVAFALGYPDGEVIPRDEMLWMVKRIAASVELPVTADMEAGYGKRPEDVGEAVRLTIEAGAVGMNLEDGTGNRDAPLLDFDHAVERIRAARAAADATGVPAVINARTDGYLFSRPDDKDVLKDTIARGNAFMEAGARSVYVPFIADAAVIGTLAKEIAGPLNVLAGPKSPPLAELKALGVARVSVGGAIARAAYALARRAAEGIRESGTFTFAGDAIPHPEMNALLKR